MVSPALTQPSTDNAAPKANKNTQYVYVYVYDDDNDSDGEDNGDDGDDDEVNGKSATFSLESTWGNLTPLLNTLQKLFVTIMMMIMVMIMMMLMMIMMMKISWSQFRRILGYVPYQFD